MIKNQGNSSNSPLVGTRKDILQDHLLGDKKLENTKKEIKMIDQCIQVDQRLISKNIQETDDKKKTESKTEHLKSK